VWLVAFFPEVAHSSRKEPEHPTYTLKVGQRGHLTCESIEDLWMEGIGAAKRIDDLRLERLARNRISLRGPQGPVCVYYYMNEAGTATKTSKAGGDGITVQLSILGGLVIKDHLDFRKKFGSETTGGLYDRMTFATAPTTWEFTVTQLLNQVQVLPDIDAGSAPGEPVAPPSADGQPAWLYHRQRVH
jgi:hypothetical protein